MPWRTLAALLLVPLAARSMADDTDRLVALAKQLRASQNPSPAQYAAFQAAYLDWIDARMRTGSTLAKMNAGLKSAALLQTSGDFFHSPAGFVSEVSARPVAAAPDITAIVAGTFLGQGCSLNDTLVLYQRNPVRRLAAINPNPSFAGQAYILSGVDVGSAAPARTIATGWTISNCTSTWNGKLIRIDRLQGAALVPLLERSLRAQDRDGENVSARLQGDLATFFYTGVAGAAMTVPSILRYRVSSATAVRVTPIALTRAGFLQEWLQMDDAAAALHSAPAAAAVHHAVAAAFQGLFDWERIARCRSTPPSFELTVRFSESRNVHAFRIGGATASTLRILSVSDRPAPSCDEIQSPPEGIPEIVSEIPW